MPQMMPLMWVILFILFSLLLGISFLKVYFSCNKPSFYYKAATKTPISSTQNKIWTW
nr:ATP synthase F0 subunit 8 [Homidia koreana]